MGEGGFLHVCSCSTLNKTAFYQITVVKTKNQKKKLTSSSFFLNKKVKFLLTPKNHEQKQKKI